MSDDYDDDRVDGDDGVYPDYDYYGYNEDDYYYYDDDDDYEDYDDYTPDNEAQPKLITRIKNAIYRVRLKIESITCKNAELDDIPF